MVATDLKDPRQKGSLGRRKTSGDQVANNPDHWALLGLEWQFRLETSNFEVLLIVYTIITVRAMDFAHDFAHDFARQKSVYSCKF